MNIKIQNVSKIIKKQSILKNLNLEFEAGKIYGLKGENGSGKSVLMKVLCGFYEPTSGVILYNDQRWEKGRSCPIRIRALIEKPNFFPFLTGYENLKLLASLEKSITKERIDEVLQVVGLE